MPQVDLLDGSLAGFIAGAAGEIDWSAPDSEFHQFHNYQLPELGAHLCGRRLYETMSYRETVDEIPAAAKHELEFARIWKPPNVAFSRSLERVEDNARLAADGLVEELAWVRGQSDKDIVVGGSGLACTLIKRIDLELIEDRTFGSRAVYLRYRRV
jgi:dihydrofolate reductase